MFYKSPLLKISIFLAFIPSVSFGIGDFDTQPFAALFGLVAIALMGVYKYPYAIWVLLIPSVSALVLSIDATESMLVLRAIFIYASPLIFSCIGYLAVKKYVRIDKYVTSMLVLWFVAGCLQLLIEPSILNILLNSRTTEGRGVTGLAPEPSYYGLTIIQMWLLLYVVNKKRALRLDVLTICALQIFVLSKSPLAIIIAISLLFLYFLFNPNKILLIVLIVLMGVFIFSDIFIISGRFARFIEVVKENPGGLLYVDGSVSERFFHIYLSIKHSFANYLVPHGFNSFEYVVDLGQSQYDAYWWAMAKTKILSGIGASLFELGWFGLVYIFSFIYFVIYYQKNLIKDRYLILVGFFLIMINAVNYSAPCFWLMMGYVAAANRPSIKTKSSSINNSHDELIS